VTKGRRYRKADPEYGPICPRCAGPKNRETGQCWDCYTDRRRQLEYPLPPVPERKPKAAPTGAGRGRPQPQDHPWRKAEKLRLTQLRDAA